MENKDVISTLGEIRDMMEKSSRFLSLDGLSVAIVGVYAVVASLVARTLFKDLSVHHLYDLPGQGIFQPAVGPFAAVALILLAVSLCTVFTFSWRKARQNRRSLKLDPTTRRLLWNFFLPLFSGGLFCIALLLHRYYSLLSPTMLVFYGLSLINASKYTYSDIRYLGYAELAFGLFNCFITGYGLLFWTLGFGVLHIIYGTRFYLKYDRKKG